MALLVVRVALLVACLLSAHSSLLGLPSKSYTLHTPKLRDLIKWYGEGTIVKKGFGKMSSSVSVKSFDMSMQLVDVVGAMDRVVRSTNFFEYAGTKVVQDSEYCLVSSPTSPLGWSNTMFQKKSVSHNHAGDSDSVTDIEYTTVDCLKKYSQTACIRIRYSIQHNDGAISITRRCAHKHIVKDKVDDIVLVMDQLVIAEIQRELELLTARTKQQEQHKRKSLLETKKRKIKELDKIIHPEKYRGKSPSVRRIGSGEGGDGKGSGRYTPGASTQMRRQVKRGG